MPQKTVLPRDAWVLTLIAFLVALGFGVVVPVLPVFAREFGATNTQVGLVVSTFAVLKLATGPFCGPINARFGERRVLATGMFIVAASSLGCGLAQSYLQMLLLRGAGGFGSALFSTAAMSQLLAATKVSNRGRATGLYQGGYLIGNMTGPALGAVFTAISIRAPFFFYTLTLVIGGIAGMILLRTGSTFDSGADKRTGIGEVWRDRRYVLACLANFSVGWQGFGVRSTLIPILIVETMGKPTTWTGIILAIAAGVQICVIPPVGRAVDTAGRKPVLVAGLVICAATSAVFALAPNVFWLTLMLSGFAIGSAMLGTAPAAMVGDIAPKGTPVAVFQMCADLGNIFGPLVAGAIVDMWSMSLAFQTGAALMVLVALLSVTVKIKPAP